MSLAHRHDFVLLFDVKDGNPNGDPDAGNLPRTDDETGHGLVTDVALKRKVRNYVALTHDQEQGVPQPGERRHEIYVREKAILNLQHQRAYSALGLDAPPAEDAAAEAAELPPADDGKKNIKKAAAPKDKRKGSASDVEQARRWMCQNFFDVRTFGAVMSTGVNSGQVRGPVQMTFGRSIHPIARAPHAITRMAVATEAEAEKQKGDNRTMGRKHTVPYGLYRSHGFVSSFLAKQTGFGDDDLELLFKALEGMFEHDRSAARGEMATRGLYVFRHDSALGNAPAHALFDRLQVQSRQSVEDAPPIRDFASYAVTFDGRTLDAGESVAAAPGVTLTRRC